MDTGSPPLQVIREGAVCRLRFNRPGMSPCGTAPVGLRQRLPAGAASSAPHPPRQVLRCPSFKVVIRLNTRLSLPWSCRSAMK